MRQQKATYERLLQAAVPLLEQCPDDEAVALLSEMQVFMRPLGIWPYDKEE